MTVNLEGRLRGERVPPAVPLVMAAFGVIAAIGSAQLVATAADASTDDEHLVELGSSSPAGTAEPSAPEAESSTTIDDDPAGDAANGSAPDEEPAGDAANGSAPDEEPDERTSTTAAPDQVDCPPLFNVRFPLGSAVPIDELGEDASSLASWLAANPDTQLLIEGHADAAGTEQANLQLSFRRAETTADLLIAEGVDAARIQSRGFGEYQPIVGEPPDSERNRRVTMQVVGYESCSADERDANS